MDLIPDFFTIERAREQRNAEQNRRREELHRRIEETRLKLQSVSVLQYFFYIFGL